MPDFRTRGASNVVTNLSRTKTGTANDDVAPGLSPNNSVCIWLGWSVARSFVRAPAFVKEQTNTNDQTSATI